jgi:hypothetical protein
MKAPIIRSYIILIHHFHSYDEYKEQSYWQGDSRLNNKFPYINSPMKTECLLVCSHSPALDDILRQKNQIRALSEERITIVGCEAV